MNARSLVGWMLRLANWPHLLLAGHLFLLHGLAFGGWQGAAIRLSWVVAVGLFLIWQPFVAGGRQISTRHSVVLLLVVAGSLFLLGPWLLLVWCGALAATIGCRVFWTVRRRERTGYLLAFGYLMALTVIGVVPELSPAVRLDPPLRQAFAHYMPAVLPVLLLFPVSRQERPTGEAFDLFYGLLVFLAMAAFVLGALAYMLISGASYLESIFITSMGLAGALLLLAWVWNPRSGVFDAGSALSRYLLSVGLPLEQWVIQLSEASERQPDPYRFLDALMQRLAAAPWVAGIGWTVDGQANQHAVRTGYRHACSAHGAELVVYFRNAPSPAMRWHVDWLLRLAIEFFQVKRQSEQLRRMGYVQAIHETGARVTHDVKNLLQSLQTLCYAVTRPGHDADEVAGLLSRQLPQIADRLKITLEKLQSPQSESSAPTDAVVWWQRLRERYAHAGVDWRGEVMAGQCVPAALYDSAAENLLQNALAKRLREPGVLIGFEVETSGFAVCDNGSAIAPRLADDLFKSPVTSEDGLGVGLYQVARLAVGQGYGLTLADNRPGRVCFRLERLP